MTELSGAGIKELAGIWYYMLQESAYRLDNLVFHIVQPVNLARLRVARRVSNVLCFFKRLGLWIVLDAK